MMKRISILLLFLASSVSVALAQQPLMNQQTASEAPVPKDKRVCIVGNVVKPSEITFTDDLTVTQAIKEAGGILRTNKVSEVRVFSAMIGGGTRVIYVDLKKIENKPYRDLELQDNDTLYVEPLKREKTDVQTSNPCPLWSVFKNRL